MFINENNELIKERDIINILTKTDLYYLNIARSVGDKSTCLRRKFGAIIVKNDVIVGTGFNGAARGCTHCNSIGCLRDKLNIPKGQRYELCRSVHAEQNAIINSVGDIIGGTLYIVCNKECEIEPCIMCKRVILNAQLSKVITPTKTFDVKDFIDADIIGYDNYALQDNNKQDIKENLIDKKDVLFAVEDDDIKFSPEALNDI